MPFVAGRYTEAQANWERAVDGAGDPHMLCERADALIRLGDQAAHDAAYRALVASREAEDRDAVLDALNLATVARYMPGVCGRPSATRKRPSPCWPISTRWMVSTRSGYSRG